jgi:hypothetical protein
MSGASCSGGTLLHVIEAAPAAEALSSSLPEELAPGKPLPILPRPSRAPEDRSR